MDFWVLVFLFAIAIGAAVAVLSVMWRYWWSIKVVGPNKVGVRLFFGNPEPVAYQSGKVFVPWIPLITWDGHKPWELVLLPMDAFKLSYTAEPSDKIYSKHKRTLLFPEVTLYITLPWAEPESLIKILKTNVPLEKQALADWAEDVVMPALKRFLRDMEYEDAISGDLEEFGRRVTETLCEEESIFFTTGVTGEVPADNRPGHGYVCLTVEGMGVPKELEDALAAPEIAKQRADAAKETARQEATETAGAWTLMIDEQIKAEEDAGVTINDEDRRRIRAECLNILLRGRAAKVGGLKDVRIGNADGTSFAQGSLSEIVGGIVAAVATAYTAKEQGGDQGNRGGNSGGGRKLTNAEKHAEADRIMKGG